MDSKKRCPNFTLDDKLKLIQLIQNEKGILLNKKTDGTTNKLKESAWNTILMEFNATSNVHRPLDSLKKMWNGLKSTAKTYKAKQRISITKTGGGQEDVKVDPILEEVLKILGRGGVGLTSVMDSDYVVVQSDDQNDGTLNVATESEEATTSSTTDSLALELEQSQILQNLPIHVNTTPSNRRRPYLPKTTDDFEQLKMEYERAKIEAIHKEDARAAELHNLNKRKLEQDIEIREIIKKKIMNNENVEPYLINLLIEK